MYDRRFGKRELSFEASGALLRGSLVMRDRETDSWWSIMTSDAIGGELTGAELTELPAGQKTTWGLWREEHPETLALSIDGREHEEHDGYASYWKSERTFRDLEVTDRRLPAKEPVFSFWVDGEPFAVAHRDFEGGRLLDLGPAEPRRVYLYRPAGAPLLQSSRALLLPAEMTKPAVSVPGERAVAALVAAGAVPVEGFDTFWYSWIAVQGDSVLLPLESSSTR